MMCHKCGMEIGDTTTHSCALVTTFPPTDERRPWKCPVCNGSGKVLPVGSATTITEYVCHACKGTGIVWG